MQLLMPHPAEAVIVEEEEEDLIIMVGVVVVAVAIIKLPRLLFQLVVVDTNLRRE